MNENIHIAGTGSYIPDSILTNGELVARLAEDGIESSDEWIVTRTGIKERRIAAPWQSTSDLGMMAGQRALEAAGMEAAGVELIICATSTPDMYLPSTACLIQGKLGAHNAAAMDVNAACSGFVYALATAYSHLKASNLQSALVIGAECYSRIVDWKDRTSCVFFGDGAGAVVLTKSEDGRGIRGVYLGADGAKGESIMVPACGTPDTAACPTSIADGNDDRRRFSMKGRDIYDFAVNTFPLAVTRLLEQEGCQTSHVDLLISHQANINIIRESLLKLGIPESKSYVNLERYGNTAAASIPIALDEAFRLGVAVRGSTLLLVGFGGGLTWGSALVDL